MAKVVVYGTLRKGENNHYHLVNEKFLGEFESEPVFNMHSIGSFPALTKGGNTSVKMEVYEVNEGTLAQLDRLEGYRADKEDSNLYNRFTLVTPFGMAKIYLYNQSVKGKARIDSGDWVEYNKLNKTRGYVQSSN